MKRLSLMLVIGSIFIAQSVYAAGFTGSLTVDRFWLGGSFVNVGFTSPPSGCAAAGYFGAHGRILKSHPAFEELYALLLTARTSGKKVDIWFDDSTGSCTTNAAGDLVVITQMGLSREVVNN